MQDGWHTLKGYKVYVENDRVLRGVLGEADNQVTAFPYRQDKKHKNLWDKAVGITCSAFVSGVRRGTVRMF